MLIFIIVNIWVVDLSFLFILKKCSCLDVNDISNFRLHFISSAFRSGYVTRGVSSCYIDPICNFYSFYLDKAELKVVKYHPMGISSSTMPLNSWIPHYMLILEHCFQPFQNINLGWLLTHKPIDGRVFEIIGNGWDLKDINKNQYISTNWNLIQKTIFRQNLCNTGSTFLLKNYKEIQEFMEQSLKENFKPFSKK